MRRRMAGDIEVKWKEVGTVYVENEGDILLIDGFEADRIRVTALVASVEDNKGLRFNVSKDWLANTSAIGQSTTTTLRPLTFELAVVGDYAISTPFAYPNKVITANSTNAISVLGMQLDQDEHSIKRFRMTSSNDKLIVGSWMQVEILE